MLCYQADVNVQTRLCHITCWNIGHQCAEELWKSYLFSFVAYSVSQALGAGQLFLVCKKKTYTNTLKTHLEALGASEVMIMTSGNDGGKYAGRALFSVQQLGEKSGYVGGSFGVCSKAVVLCAKRHFEQQKIARCICGRQPEDDVVKKRRLIETLPATEGDTDAEALALFEDFCNAVWPALETVSRQSEIIRSNEEAWLNQRKVHDCSSGVKLKRGFVYAAWNSCFQDVVKIGATVRDTPYARLKELSGPNVPAKFELVACIPTSDPFAVEKFVHSYFEKFRVKKENRYCEFFRISRDVVSEFFSQMIQEE